MERTTQRLKRRLVPGRNVALSAFVWTCGVARALQKAGGAVERFADGLAAPLLGPAHKAEITVRVYDRAPKPRQALFDWEQSWLLRDLPPPPARILVGGCGTGCEVRALLDRGYEVWAFDPSLEAVRACARDNAAVSFNGCFSYEDLSRSLLSPDRDNCRGLLPPDTRFEAVLLGWGSLTHVLEQAAQHDIFHAFELVAPGGPILASFFFTDSPPAVRRSRAFDLGRAIASRLPNADPQPDSRIRLLSHAGFAYFFDEERLHALAAGIGRHLELHLTRGYAHATFRPIQ